MKKINIFLKTGLCLLIVISFLQCNIKTSSECKSKKVQLLLEDLFKKKTYFPILGNFNPTIEDPFNIDESDSSMYFNYLYSQNLEIPDKEFYLHGNKYLAPSYPDSVKLREIIDPLMKNRYAQVVGIKLLEVNEDTTKLKIILSYGTINNFAIDEGTFTYSFDERNCRWIVLDSTLVRY